MVSRTQRCQLLEFKYGWNANSKLLNRLTSWGLAGSKVGSKVKGPVTLRYLNPSTILQDLVWGKKFTTVAKNFFSINQPINLLQMFELLAFTHPSSFQLDSQPLYLQWVLSFEGECKRKSHCVKSVSIWCFSGPNYPAFGVITEMYRVSLRIWPECEKIRTRNTLNTDIFHKVSTCL